jgi:hypothetical protein
MENILALYYICSIFNYEKAFPVDFSIEDPSLIHNYLEEEEAS